MRSFNCILLIDDDPYNNTLNEHIIHNLGITNLVKTTTRGKEALEFLKEYSLKHLHNAPELIFLDLNMPEMSGFEFLNEFKKLHFSNKSHIEIIVLTSSSSPNDFDKMQQQKIKYHITKPLTEDKIVDFFVYGYTSQLIKSIS